MEASKTLNTPTDLQLRVTFKECRSVGYAGCLGSLGRILSYEVKSPVDNLCRHSSIGYGGCKGEGWDA